MSVRETLTPEKLIELHVRQNITLSQIGVMYSISKQRVHQLKKEYESNKGRIQRRLSLDVFSLKHHLDQGWSVQEIASHFKMKDSKVARLIRKYKTEYDCGQSNIRIAKRSLEDILPKENLFNLYVNQLYTDAEISEKYQISVSSVNNLRKKYKIKSLKTKSLRKLPNDLTPQLFRQLYVIEGYTLETIAEKFQCSVVSVIKLKKIYKSSEMI